MKADKLKISLNKVFAAVMVFVILAAGASISNAADVTAGVADRATRQVDVSLREEAERRLKEKKERIEKEEAEEEEKVYEGPRFVVKKINLIGVESLSADEFVPVLEKYENREVTVIELGELAKEIERTYLKHGIIAAAFLPAQEVKTGEVKLRVVEAILGNVKIKEHKFFDEDLMRMYWNIYPGEVLRYDKMSKSLQLMNKNPDRDVTATLHAGTKAGTTDVLMTPSTNFPVHLF